MFHFDLKFIDGLKRKSSCRRELISNLCNKINEENDSKNEERSLSNRVRPAMEVQSSDGLQSVLVPEECSSSRPSSNEQNLLISDENAGSSVSFEATLAVPVTKCGLNVPIEEGEYVLEESQLIKIGGKVDPILPHVIDEEQEPSDQAQILETNELVLLELNLNNEIRIELETNEQLPEPEVQFTKKGEIRKRKKFTLSVSEREEEKQKKIKMAHGLTEKCKNSCRLKCSLSIAEDQRLRINEEYWTLTRHSQKQFVMGSIKKKPVQRRTTWTDSSRRAGTLDYCLKDENGYEKRVCKIFFLSTLGYGKNDSIIQSVVKESGVSPRVDKRKGRVPPNKINKIGIIDHIKSFKPKISHYRREHAPNRLYLPSDLSITTMFTDFKQKNPNFTCSYELYREQVDKLNISFVKLGHEECEICEHFKIHSHSPENLDLDCVDCKTWVSHKNRAETARELYTADKSMQKNPDEIIYSMDLQKVIMLPRMDMFKSVIFAYRLSVYNLTFAPVGSSKSTPAVPVLWHEAISGRKQEDIISAIEKFLLSNEARDASKICIWMDNCSSQNKNWALLTFMVHIVNSKAICAQNITLKYFEPGHTFMSADSFHHSVEKSMKSHMKSKVYDFNDFTEATCMASKNVKTKKCKKKKCKVKLWTLKILL